MCCFSLTNESLNSCESWFWQHRCSHWSGRLLQQEGVSHSLTRCGSKKLWQSQEQQLETRNHPCEFHSGALTSTSCSPLQIIPEKGGKYETRKQESWWVFMFWVCFPHVYEYFKWVRKIPLYSIKKNTVCVFDAEDIPFWESYLLSMDIAQSINVWMVTVLLVMSYCFTVFGRSLYLCRPW